MMARRRKRLFTPDERREVQSLCFRGKLGQLSSYDTPRCAELQRISPEEYSEISERARADAVRSYQSDFNGDDGDA